MREPEAVKVLVVPEDVTPIALGAIVEEEDTFLALSAALRIDDTRESLGNALAAVRRARPMPPGSVVLRRGKPLRLLAVIHDLAQTPSWHESWIAASLAGCLRVARRLRLRSLSLPLLGAVHGRFPPERFVALLRDALAEAETSDLERVWLRVPGRMTAPITKVVREVFPTGTRCAPEGDRGVSA